MQKIEALKLTAKQEKEVLTWLKKLSEGKMRPHKRAEEWQEKNNWFGKQKRKTIDALALHGVLLEAGLNPNGPKYYKLIDRFFELKSLSSKQEEKK